MLFVLHRGADDNWRINERCGIKLFRWIRLDR
jgi:hypothetical protein